MTRAELVITPATFSADGATFGKYLHRYKTPSHYFGAEWPEFFPVYARHR